MKERHLPDESGIDNISLAPSPLQSSELESRISGLNLAWLAQHIDLQNSSCSRVHRIGVIACSQMEYMLLLRHYVASP